MAQYSAETIAEILGCSHQIAAHNRLRFLQFFEDRAKLPAILAYHGQAPVLCPQGERTEDPGRLGKDMPGQGIAAMGCT